MRIIPSTGLCYGADAVRKIIGSAAQMCNFAISEDPAMPQIVPAKRENLPGVGLVGSVVAAAVWLVLYRLGLDGAGLIDP